MDGAAKHQAGSFKGFRQLVDVLELVFQAALEIEIHLAGGKVVHSFILPVLPGAARSFCWRRFGHIV